MSRYEALDRLAKESDGWGSFEKVNNAFGRRGHRRMNNPITDDTDPAAAILEESQPAWYAQNRPQNEKKGKWKKPRREDAGFDEKFLRTLGFDTGEVDWENMNPKQRVAFIEQMEQRAKNEAETLAKYLDKATDERVYTQYDYSTPELRAAETREMQARVDDYGVYDTASKPLRAEFLFPEDEKPEELTYEMWEEMLAHDNKVMRRVLKGKKPKGEEWTRDEINSIPYAMRTTYDKDGNVVQNAAWPPTPDNPKIDELYQVYRRPATDADLEGDIKFFVDGVEERTNLETLEPEFEIYGRTDAESPLTVCATVTDWRPYFYVQVPENFSNYDAKMMRYAMLKKFLQRNGHVTESKGRRGAIFAGFASRTKEYKVTKENERKALERLLPVCWIDIERRQPSDGMQLANDRKIKVAKITYGHPELRTEIAKLVYEVHMDKYFQDKRPGMGQLGKLFEFRVKPVARFCSDIGDNALASSKWITIPSENVRFYRSMPYGFKTNGPQVPPSLKHATRGTHRVSIDMITSQNNIIVHNHADKRYAGFASMRGAFWDIEAPSNVKGQMPQFNRDGINQISLVTVNTHDPTKYHKIIFAVGTVLPIPGVTIVECSDEAQMLMMFCEEFKRQDPDWMVSWNGNHFDNDQCVKRCEWLKGLGYMKTNPFYSLGRSTRKRSSGIVTTTFNSNARGLDEGSERLIMQGRVQMDLMEAIKVLSPGLPSYSLNNISKAFLSETKLEIQHDQVLAMQRAGPRTRKEVAVYCLRDSVLLPMIMFKRKVLYVLFGQTRACGVITNILWENGQQIKTMTLLRHFSRKRGVIIQEREPQAFPEGYPGALVVPPEIGWYDTTVFTLDFKSLYPSIMRAYNMCFTTFIPPRLRDAYIAKYGRGTHHVTPAGHWFTKLYDGILPSILAMLWAARDAAKAEMKAAKKAGDMESLGIFDGMQLGIKITMNSVYGFTGATAGMLPCLEISESVTAYGQDLIRMTWNFIETEFDSRDKLRALIDRHYKDRKFNAQLHEWMSEIEAKYPKGALSAEDRKVQKQAEVWQKIGINPAVKVFGKGDAKIKRVVAIAKAKKKGKNNKVGLQAVQKTEEELAKEAEEAKVPTQKVNEVEWMDPIRMTVVYGDTDSVMVNSHMWISELVAALAIAINTECNECLFKDLVSVELEYEKQYNGYLLEAKKRYAGMKLVGFLIMGKSEGTIDEDDDHEMETEIPIGVKMADCDTGHPPDPTWDKENNDEIPMFSYSGIELVRKDTFPMLKVVLFWTLWHIIIKRDKEAAFKYIEEAYKKIYAGKFPMSLFVYSKGLNKPLSAYAASASGSSLPPHVAHAKNYNEANPTNKIQVGDRVRFVFTCVPPKSRLAEAVADPFDALAQKLPIDYDKYTGLITDALMRALVPMMGEEKAKEVFHFRSQLSTYTAVSESELRNYGQRTDMTINPKMLTIDELRDHVAMKKEEAEARNFEPIAMTHNEVKKGTKAKLVSSMSNALRCMECKQEVSPPTGMQLCESCMDPSNISDKTVITTAVYREPSARKKAQMHKEAQRLFLLYKEYKAHSRKVEAMVRKFKRMRIKEQKDDEKRAKKARTQPPGSKTLDHWFVPKKATSTPFEVKKDVVMIDVTRETWDAPNYDKVDGFEGDRWLRSYGLTPWEGAKSVNAFYKAVLERDYREWAENTVQGTYTTKMDESWTEEQRERIVEDRVRTARKKVDIIYEDYADVQPRYEKILEICTECSNRSLQNPVNCNSRDCVTLCDRYEMFTQMNDHRYKLLRLAVGNSLDF